MKSKMIQQALASVMDGEYWCKECGEECRITDVSDETPDDSAYYGLPALVSDCCRAEYTKNRWRE